MSEPEVSGTEQAIFGTADLSVIRGLLDDYVSERMSSTISAVLFRAGRIDAVWAVRLADGRDAVIKAHRAPVDLPARRATYTAQRALVEARYPCPLPLCDTGEVDGIFLSAESLVTAGSAGDAHIPAIRRALAQCLRDHIVILRSLPGLVETAGPGPAWCRYDDGAWPEPHDPIFDFSTTPAGFDWLDDVADLASDILLAAPEREIVVGHGDWYVGNTRFRGTELVGTFDWDLVAAPEAFIAGFTAAAFTDPGTGDQDLPGPDEARAFLRDYDECRDEPFTTDQQAAAAAALTWTMAYNARCQLSFLDGEPSPGSAIDLLARQRDDFLATRW